MPSAVDPSIQGQALPANNPLERIDWRGFNDFAAGSNPFLDLLNALTKFFSGGVGAIGGDITSVLGDLIGLLGGLASSLFGSLLHGSVPVGALSNDTPNLLTDFTFPVGAIVDNPDWTVDTTTTRTADGTGSAKVIANGSLKALRSGATPATVIPVAAGQTFTGSIFVSHQGYVGSGPAVRFQVVPFTGTTPGAPVDLVTAATINSTPDAQIAVTYAPTGADLAWPGKQITGSYVVPQGVTGLQARIVLTAETTAGTFWFDDGSGKQTGGVRQEWIPGLPEALQAPLDALQGLVDGILSALTGVPVVGGLFQDVFDILHVFPGDHVTGAAGPANMFDSILGIIDAILGGFVGHPGATGGGLADVTSVSGLVSSNASLGAFAWQIVNTLNNTPVARGMLPTGRANYDITSANTFLPTTQAASLSAGFGLLQSMPIGVISWYGYGTSGMTAFYINIRKVNPTTGARDLVHHSANIVSSLQPGTTSANGNWMFYTLPTPLAGLNTDSYYVEFVPVGGTHNIRGISFSDNIKDHPYAPSPCVGTTVDYTSNPDTPAASLAKPTAGPNVPWIEFAVKIGDVTEHHEPTVFAFTDDSETIPIPSWANRVDAIALGAGGDGHDGFPLGLAGEPGQPGKFSAVTWSRNGEFIGDSTSITFNVLTDGSAKLSIPGHDVTGDDGANGASTKFGLTPVGKGPGILDYNGQHYIGGVDQKVAGAAGTNPGGGGNGGSGLLGQGGGHGGKAAGWVCFRQVEVPAEVDTSDTTPPTAPTLTVVDVTASSITVSASGGTD